MVKRLILASVLLIFVSLANYAQITGVKSNLLYWATTTPNLGVETALGKKHTAQVFFGFNPWKQSGGDQSSFVIGFCNQNTVTGSVRASMAGSWVFMPWADSLMQEE